MNIKIQKKIFYIGEIKKNIVRNLRQIRVAPSLQATSLMYINELLQTEVTWHWENQALECGSWTKPRESDVLFLICGLEDLQQSTPWNIVSESQFKNRSNIFAHQTVIIKSQYSP